MVSLIIITMNADHAGKKEQQASSQLAHQISKLLLIGKRKRQSRVGRSPRKQGRGNLSWPMAQQLCHQLYLSRVALLLLLVGSPLRAEEQPTLVPARDVDITYRITRPPQPTFTERVRWSVSENLERVDGPDKLTTIVGRNGTEITVTLLDREAHTYRAVTRAGNYSKAAPRWPIQPERSAVLKREGESMVAGQPCTEWSWAVDTEIHILCGTPDGVLLRLVINGKTTVEATSVSYRQQPSKVFEVPPGYAPALEGGP